MEVAEIGTPIPNNRKETAAQGAGPVISSQLTPEELERYRAIPGRPRDGNGKVRKQPVAAHHELNSEEQRRRAEKRKESEDNEMKNQPSRHEFLRLRAAGKTHGEIENILQLSKGIISSYWLAKWDLKGITKEKAAEMLAERNPLPAEAITEPESPPAPLIPRDQTKIIESLRSEIEGARAAQVNCVATAGEAAAKFQAEIDELQNDRDEWRRTAEEVKTRSAERIRQLEADLDLIREPVVIEVPAPALAGIVTLQIPLVDTGELEIEDRLQSLVTIGDLKGKINLREFNLPRLMLETFNRLQVIVGIVYAQAADIVEPADLPRTVQQFVNRHNETHIEDLRALAGDLGWEVVGQ